jgi:isopentenyldiphosphate isomerase
MDFLDHIRHCNSYDLSGFRPFLIGSRIFGWVRHALADELRRFPEVFHIDADRVELAPRLAQPHADSAERTDQVGAVVAQLAAEGRVPKLRGELYAVIETFGSDVIFDIDRGATTSFGIVNSGFHLNGVVRGAAPEEDRMWIAQRAFNKTTFPGKLDNMVAGGHPSGLTPQENVIKECAEEAGMPEALARTARPVSILSYTMEVSDGLRRHAMLAYDIDLETEFMPVPVDGEVQGFTLYPVDEVARLVRTERDAFKYNCNLVIIDWLIRTGRLDPNHPDYLALSQGLRTTWP